MFRIEFETDNDFFQCGRISFPVGKILEQVTTSFMRCDTRGMQDQPARGIIIDGNGNNIGTWTYLPGAPMQQSSKKDDWWHEEHRKVG